MIKVTITYPDGTKEEFKVEKIEYSSGWVTMTIVDDDTKSQILSLPKESVRKIEEVEYYE
jgi:hypothetical protein